MRGCFRGQTVGQLPSLNGFLAVARTPSRRGQPRREHLLQWSRREMIGERLPDRRLPGQHVRAKARPPALGATATRPGGRPGPGRAVQARRRADPGPQRHEHGHQVVAGPLLHSGATPTAAGHVRCGRWRPLSSAACVRCSRSGGHHGRSTASVASSRARATPAPDAHQRSATAPQRDGSLASGRSRASPASMRAPARVPRPALLGHRGRRPRSLRALRATPLVPGALPVDAHWMRSRSLG